jgi:hypothetical protein
MEIRVYDSALNFLGIVENYDSLIWERNYFETGNFEITIPATENNMSLLAVGNYISKRGKPGAVSAVEAGIIEEADNTSDGLTERIVRRGRFLSSLLSRRVVRGTYTYNGTYEAAMYALVTRANAIPYLSSAPISGYECDVTFQLANKNLYNTLVKLSQASGLGFRVSADFRNKSFLFGVYQAADRTGTNGNKVIFSDTRDNIASINYTLNTSVYKNLAYVSGKNGVAVTVDRSASEMTREVYVDGGSVDNAGMTDSAYRAALTQLGIDKLNENAAIENFDVAVSPDTGYVYKVDYDLGDIVFVKQSKWGLSRKNRITRISEVYENGAERIVLTVGSLVLVKLDLSGGD